MSFLILLGLVFLVGMFIVDWFDPVTEHLHHHG